MSFTEIEDLSEYCRVCLQLPEPDQLLDLNLIYDEEEQLSYSDCFTICTQIQLDAEDRMPHNLCKSCGLELQMVYDFHKKIEESKNYLKQLEEQTYEKDEDAESLTETEKHLQEDTSTQAEIVTEIEELDPNIECDTIEEHLDMEDDFQTLEEIDEKDVEAMQIKIEDYDIIEDTRTIHENYENKMYMYEATDKSEANNDLSWEEAVVTVANKSHLPLDGSVSTITTTENDQEPIDTLESPANGEAIGTIVRERKRHTGKYSCDYCQKIFPNHSRMTIHRRSHEPNRQKYPCTHCGRVYATKQAMQVHARTVHVKKGFACPICDKIYAIKKGLEVHIRYHTGDFPYVCDLCGKKFAQMCHLNTHTNVKHNSVRFSCDHPDCGKYFTSSASLRNHEFSHSIMPFECEFCQRGYPAKSKLKVHIRRKHGVEMTLDDLENMRKFHVMRSKLNLVKVAEKLDRRTEHLSSVRERIEDIETFKCNKVEIKSEVNLCNSGDDNYNGDLGFDDLYQQFYEDIPNDEDSNAYDDNNDNVNDDDDADQNEDQKYIIQIHKVTRKNEKLSVEVLEKVEPQNARKRTRAPTVIGGPPYKCEHCEHISPSRSLLASHRHRKHRLKENRFGCPKCDKCFDTRKQLERHQKRPTCNSYPEFNCEYCGKKCIGLSNYNIHLRFHKKLYPFVCHLCAKRFMMATHLNTHIKAKHENQRFICEHPNCGKMFQTRHSLKIHAYVHVEMMPYKCDYCDRMYPSKGRLRWHISKTHGIEHSLDELDNMMVAEKLSIKAEMQPITVEKI